MSTSKDSHFQQLNAVLKLQGEAHIVSATGAIDRRVYLNAKMYRLLYIIGSLCCPHYRWCSLNPLMGTLKPQSNGPLYSNTVIRTLVVDECAVAFGTARRGLGRAGYGPAQSPPRCTKCNSAPINGLCTNFMLVDAVL